MLWEYQHPWHDDFEHAVEVFPAASYQYVLYGMGFKTKSSHLDAFLNSSETAQRHFKDVEMQTRRLMKELPNNRDLLNKINKFGLQMI